MFYRIADLYLDIRCLHARCYDHLQEFCVDEPPHIDAVIEMTEADIVRERTAALKEGSTGNYSAAYFEFLAVCRRLSAVLLMHDGFLMHGAVIEYEGRGYLFTAKSGTGKTTHILLWKKLFGEDKVTVVNGDKPFLRLVDGRFYAYGTPWCGKERYMTNTRVPLAAVCFVERSVNNHITQISAEQALPRLFSQVMITDSADLARQLELIDALLAAVPTHLLHCNTDPLAARVAYEGMREDTVCN